MATTWYVLRDGVEEGPLTGSDLKRLIAEGRLTPTQSVRREDMSQWVEAKSVKGLFPTVPPVAAKTPSPKPPDHHGSEKAIADPPVAPPAKEPQRQSLASTNRTVAIAVASVAGLLFGSCLLCGCMGLLVDTASNSVGASAGDIASGPPFNVSKGFGKGTILLDLDPEVARELEIKEIAWDQQLWKLKLTLTWHEDSIFSGGVDPWHFTVYDEHGTKLDQRPVNIPDEISLRETFKAECRLDWEDVPEATKILIHH